MNKKIIYSSLTVLVLASAAASWMYWPQLSTLAVEVEESVEEEITEFLHPEHEEESQPADESKIKLSQEQIKRFGIQIKQAGPGELHISLSTRGKIILHPDKLAHVIPKVAGIAAEAKKNIGDFVYQGEPLALLESRDMADIKAEYLAAREKEKLALSVFEREKKLCSKKIVSEEAYLQSQSAYKEARLNVQLAKNKLNLFGLEEKEITALANLHNPNLRLYEIHAPIEGTVIHRHITQGEFIDNTTAIYTIANLDKVWVEIGIYPKDLYKVKEGQQVEVIMPTSTASSQAKMIFLSPIIQNETITGKAIAELDNPEGTWRPGSFVKVNVAIENIKSPIVVPKDAVQCIDGTNCLFVKTADGFEKRAVHTGKSDDAKIEILSGINPGEPYAASQTFLLKADLGKNTMELED